EREYLADACAAQFTRYPEGLARALSKIAGSPDEMKDVSRVMAPMFIVNPFTKMKEGLVHWFSTHPPTEERIRILRAMAGGAGFMEYDTAFRRVTGRPVGVIPFLDMEQSEPLKARQSTPARVDSLSLLMGAASIDDSLSRRLR